MFKIKFPHHCSPSLNLACYWCRCYHHRILVSWSSNREVRNQAQMATEDASCYPFLDSVLSLEVWLCLVRCPYLCIDTSYRLDHYSNLRTQARYMKIEDKKKKEKLERTCPSTINKGQRDTIFSTISPTYKTFIPIQAKGFWTESILLITNRLVPDIDCEILVTC